MNFGSPRILELYATGGLEEVGDGIGRFVVARMRRISTIVQKIWSEFRLRYIKFRNPQSVLIKEINGSRMELDVSSDGRNNIERTLALEGIREPGATRHYQQCLRSLKSRSIGSIHVIDIGANVGYYALMAAEILNGDGRVYAIEADPDNVNRLQRNVHLNDYDNVETFQVAAGAERTVSSLKLSSASNLHRMADVMEDKEAVGTVEVEVHRVDDLINEWNIPEEDCIVIRMDVEGYEPFVLDGMAGLLASDRPLVILMEVHPDREAVDLKHIQNTLHQGGFNAEYISHDGGRTYTTMDSLEEIRSIDSNAHIMVSRVPA